MSRRDLAGLGDSNVIEEGRSRRRSSVSVAPPDSKSDSGQSDSDNEPSLTSARGPKKGRASGAANGAEASASKSGRTPARASGATKEGTSRRKSGAQLDGDAEVDEFDLKPRRLEQCFGENPLLLSISIDSFLERYSADGAAAVLELATSLMNASGLPDASLTIADADVDDEEEVLEALITNNTCERLVDEAQERMIFVEPYPLADKKTGKRHLKDLTALWRQLIDKTQHEVLFDGVLFPWVIEWMCAMSQSRHRGVRHTGTEAGMALMVRMTELAVELATQATAKQRQASKPGKKGGAGMAAILKEEVQRLQENETALEEMVTAAFTGLFVERYRDRAEEVRASCLSALGRVMQLHPSMFLADTYLKYLGWSLSDMAAAVRAASLSQLSAVYTAHGAAEEICRVDGKPVSGAERLLNFTRRFESRFIEMTRDVDVKVAVEAIKFIDLLHDLDLLADKAQAVSEVVRVMRNNEPSQLKALVPLVNKQMEAGAAGPPSSGKRKGKKGAAGGAASQPIVQLASYAWDTAGGEAEKMPEVCLKMALAMSDKQPLLLDWTGYTDLLLGEALDDAAEHLQGALLYLMSAGAVFVNSIKEPATPRKKRALADQDERALALSAELGRSLTELLEKYGAQREALPALLGLVGQLRLRGAQAALKGPAFGSLLEQLEACFFKHNDATSIALCAGAWSELMQQPGAPTLEEQARARFRKLSSKLVAALKPLDAHTKKKPTAPFAFDEAAIAMSRLARLVTVQPQAAAAALKPIDGLGERLVAAVEARKEQRAPADGGLVACTTLLLQLETTVLCAAFSEVYDEPSEAVLEKRDDLLLLLGRALHAPSAAVARLAAALLAWLLQSTCSIEKGSGASEEAEEAEGGTPQESREALLTWFDAQLERAAAGELEEEEEVQEQEDGGKDDGLKVAVTSGPKWLSDVVKSGLAGGVSFAAAVRLLLVHLDHLPRDYKEFAKELWGHIAKVRPHELSDRQLGVLTLSFEEDEPAVFEAVAKQVAKLPAPAGAAAKGKAGEAAQATIEAGAAWALEPGHARDRARFVEGGLAPLLALCTAKGAALIARGELSDRFGGKSATLYPRWNRELRKVAGSERGRSKGLSAASPRQAASASRSRARARVVEEEEDEDEDEEAGGVQLYEAGGAAESWVACERCDKWRRVRAADTPRGDQPWFCTMHPDARFASCDAPEEAWDEEEWEEVPLEGRKRQWPEESAAPGGASEPAAGSSGAAAAEAQGVRLHLSSSSSTGYKCVKERSTGRFEAKHSVGGKKVYLGTFGTAVEAAVAYARAAGEAPAAADGEEVAAAFTGIAGGGGSSHVRRPPPSLPPGWSVIQSMEDGRKRSAFTGPGGGRASSLPDAWRKYRERAGPAASRPAKRDRAAQSDAEGDGEEGEEEGEEGDGEDLVVDGVAEEEDRRAEAEHAAWEARGRVPSEIDVYWPDDLQFYVAEVLGFDASTGKHVLRYHIDKQVEELDLSGEKWYRHLRSDEEGGELLRRITAVFEAKRTLLSSPEDADREGGGSAGDVAGGSGDTGGTGPSAATGPGPSAGAAASGSGDSPLRRASAVAAMGRLSSGGAAPRGARGKPRPAGRCGACEGCANYRAGLERGRSVDCGVCGHCRDMTKFGGRGRLKQICEVRFCEAHPSSRKSRLAKQARLQAVNTGWAESYMEERDKWERGHEERCEAQRAAREARTAQRAQIRAARLAARREARRRREREARKRGSGGGGGGGAAKQRAADAPPRKREPPTPRVVEAVLESNGQPGYLERFLVKWAKRPKSEATWEPLRKLPAEQRAALVTAGREAFNRRVEPLLSGSPAEPSSSGVVAVQVPEHAAARCAAHLHTRWRDGRLLLRQGATSCLGYSTYGKTLSAHDAQQQATHTLLMTNTLLPLIRDELPGFGEMEQFLVAWLHETYGVVVELYFAHALRQSTLTVRSTGFDVHQDTEDFPFIEFTVVVKLTPDAPGSPHSRMRLVGAPRVFEYGAPAGSAGAFLARAFHASIEPDAGTSEHLKIAFFFRASTKGERRAKRGLSAAVLASGVEDELARRRRHVALELSNSNLEAQALAAEKKLAPWG